MPASLRSDYLTNTCLAGGRIAPEWPAVFSGIRKHHLEDARRFYSERLVLQSPYTNGKTSLCESGTPRSDSNARHPP